MKITTHTLTCILLGIVTHAYVYAAEPPKPTSLPDIVNILSNSGIYFEAEGKKITVSDMAGQPWVHINEQTAQLRWPVAAGKVVLEITAKQQHFDLNLYVKQGFFKSLFGKKIAPSAWGFSLPVAGDEYVSGAFERVVDGDQSLSWQPGLTTAMNLRGERVEVKLKPTVSAYAPFYLSSQGYGLYIQGSWPGIFDFGHTHKDKLAVHFEGPSLQFKYYAGTPLQIVQQHALDSGPSIVPPKWAFGPWRWRDNHENQKTYYDQTPVAAPYNSALVEDILLMQAYDIPCSAYWIDRPWGPGSRGYDNFDWDDQRFPKAQAMLDWLQGKDIAPMIWIAPFVMADMADYAEARNYQLDSKPWWNNSRQVLLDFTHPEAVAWWGENGPAKLAKQGVKGFKLDRADGEKLKDELELRTHNNTSYRESYNDYPRQYVKAAYDAVKPILGDDFVLFPRAQYTGSARYGAMWAGDTGGSEWGLRSAIVALLRSSIMGYPVWGSDTGGYNPNEFDPEVTTRWLGFSAFSPIMEVGPTADRGLWDLPEAPHYQPQIIAAWRFYAKLKQAMMDYSFAAARAAQASGTPIARPLYLAYPEQHQAWEDWQTYLYGSDILVSPIWRKGVTEHQLYLPAGETWIDLWHPNREIKGGQTLTVAAATYQIPVFLRKGSTLTLPNFPSLWAQSLQLAQTPPDLKHLEQQERW